mgnify:CR=1 FL=1
MPAALRRAVGWAAEKLPPVRGVNFLVRRAKPLEERYIGNTNLLGERQKKKLLRRYVGEPDAKKAMAKLMAAMARRGYDFESARRAVEQALEEAQGE